MKTERSNAFLDDDDDDDDDEDSGFFLPWNQISDALITELGCFLGSFVI